MKEFFKNITNVVANVQKFCIFASTESVLLLIGTAYGSFAKKVLSTKDNTPSRLTSVAHLGGLFFYKPLAL